MCLDGYGTLLEHGFFGSYWWGFDQALKPNDLLGIAMTRPELFGKPLAQFMRRGSQHLTLMTGQGETLAQHRNRVALDSRVDRRGVPLARIDYSVGDRARSLWEHVCAEGRRVMEAAGAEQVWLGEMIHAHPLGGTVMGSSAENSVTDSFGRVHDFRNLFVAGGSLFPSIGGVGPTFTIYALAARAAEHIDRAWQTVVE
jgi:choline dehydrogenase-like flavoprotein